MAQSPGSPLGASSPGGPPDRTPADVVDALTFEDPSSANLRLTVHKLTGWVQNSDFAEDFLDRDGLNTVLKLMKNASGNLQGSLLQVIKGLLVYVNAIDQVAESPDLVDKIYGLLCPPPDGSPINLGVARSVLELLIVICGVLPEGHRLINDAAKKKSGVDGQPYSVLVPLLAAKGDLITVRNALTFINILMTKRKSVDELAAKNFLFRLKECGVLALLKPLSIVEDDGIRQQLAVFQRIGNFTIPRSWEEAQKYKTLYDEMRKRYDQANESLFVYQQQQAKVRLMKLELSKAQDTIRALTSVMPGTSTLTHPTKRFSDGGGLPMEALISTRIEPVEGGGATTATVSEEVARARQVLLDKLFSSAEFRVAAEKMLEPAIAARLETSGGVRKGGRRSGGRRHYDEDEDDWGPPPDDDDDDGPPPDDEDGPPPEDDGPPPEDDGPPADGAPGTSKPGGPGPPGTESGSPASSGGAAQTAVATGSSGGVVGDVKAVPATLGETTVGVTSSSGAVASPTMGGPPTGGPPPPPPPPGRAGGPPPPPPKFGAAAASGPKDSRVMYKGPAPTKKMRPLHWDKVPLDAADSESVWAKIYAGSVHSEFDYGEFETMFSHKEVDAKEKEAEAAAAAAAAKAKKVMLLDSKTFQNVSIMLHKLPSIPTIQRALIEMDAETLKRDMLASVIARCPKPEAVQEFTIAQANTGKPFEDYEPPEQFYSMAITMPEFRRRCQSWLFALEWDDSVVTASQPLQRMLEAVNAVLESPSLPIYFAVLLGFGNMMNYGNNLKGNAGAFGLQTLSKLEASKDNRGKISLMQHLLTTVKSRYPDALNLHEELKPLFNSVQGLKSDDLEKSMTEAEKTLEQCKSHSNAVRKALAEKGTSPDDQFAPRMAEFLVRAAKDVEQMQGLFNSFKEAYARLLKFFAIPVSKGTKIEEIFNELIPFVERVKKEALEVAKEKKRLQRKGQRIDGGGLSNVVDRLQSEMSNAA